MSRLRAPLDTSGGRATTTAEMNTAVAIVRRSGVLEVLGPAFENDVGRPRTLPLGALLVAGQLNALARHHVGHLVEIARVLNALTDDQRTRLGIATWDPEQAYDRVERLFLRLCDALEADADHGPTWFANALANAAIPDDIRTSASVAVDGTDVETWGALHGDAETVALDGEAAETQQMDAPPRKRKVRKARVFGVGADGRNLYTKDVDARAGHRSATNSRSAGPYIGYEAHLAVQTRDVRWTNGVDKTTLGPEVAGVITAFNFVPAGTHRGDAIVSELFRDQTVKDVVWDPGYSLCRPDTAYFPLAAAGVHATFQPVTHQRGIKPFGGRALLIDGALFSPLPAGGPAQSAGAAAWVESRREVGIRGEVQLAGAVAVHATRRSRRRGRYAVAVPVLLLVCSGRDNCRRPCATAAPHRLSLLTPITAAAARSPRRPANYRSGSDAWRTRPRGGSRWGDARWWRAPTPRSRVRSSISDAGSCACSGARRRRC